MKASDHYRNNPAFINFIIIFSPGHTIAKVLDVLDTLDRHNFHKVENDSSLDTLYDKIFTANLHKEGSEVSL